jgi:hypothetical protein
MPAFRVAPLFCILLIALCPAGVAAQTYVVHRMSSGPAKGYADVHIAKAALAGQQVRLWWATLLNPDCTAAGTMETQVVGRPRHGTLLLSDDPVYPDFVAPNPRAACDDRKVPGKQAFYTPDRDYHGHDKVVLTNATSEGRVRRIVVDIDVR